MTFPLDLPSEPCNNYPVQRDEFGGVVSWRKSDFERGYPLENALRRFHCKVQQEDVMKEGQHYSFSLTPGEEKRVKEALARKRSRKKARKEQD